jgi:hypothetical protein
MSDRTLVPGEGHAPDYFRKLPEPIELEETVESVETDDAPDPEGGRNPQTEFMLRYAG